MDRPSQGGNDDEAEADKRSGRLLIEEYVHVLARHVAAAHADSASDWLGYEYWVQRVDHKQTPAFHYDKDEAKSSLDRSFVYPDVSTIFYIRSVLLACCAVGGQLVVFVGAMEADCQMQCT